MRVHNLFSMQKLNFDALTLKTHAQHIQQGRLLYEYQDNEHHYWIKTQLNGINQQYEYNFQREIDFYQYAREKMSSIVPYHTITNAPLTHSDYEFGQQCLLLEHVPILFDAVPHDLKIEKIVHYMLQVFSAIQCLHMQGWVHGDLKKEHIGQINRQIKFLDFEQSFNLHEIQQIQPSCLNATPRYMAPELFHREAKSIASDIYALGIIFLEWLTKKRLQGRSYQDWALLHCQTLEIELPRQYICFQGILNQMLMKEKNRREVDIFALKRRLIVDIV